MGQGEALVVLEVLSWHSENLVVSVFLDGDSENRSLRNRVPQLCEQNHHPPLLGPQNWSV